jgi:putative metallopeptidase DUF4344
MRLITKNRALLLMAIISALLSGQALAATPRLKSNLIGISYVKPQNPAHQPIYEFVKEQRVLERLQGYLSHIRLPKTLLLKTEGCDGESNAWYENSDNSVTVCYEYLEELKKNAPDKTTPSGVTPQDAVYGPIIEVFLHEVSHALFDQLKIPVLGREEDAADLLAAYSMLKLDKDIARRTVSGVAYMYGREARSENLKFERFADAHGLSAQRLYNLLCIAYGSDSKLFSDVVEKGWLPKSRAEDCADEYKQIEYAAEKLLDLYVDEAAEKKPDRKKLMRPMVPIK